MATQHQDILPPEQFIDDEIVAPDNPKHKLFADEYLRLGNATQAAINVGYSERTARTQAAQIRAKPDVSAYIAAMQAKSTRETAYDATKWQRELIGIAHSNVQDFTRLNEDGDLEVDFSGATREQLAAVSGVKVKKRKIYDSRGNMVGEEHQSEFRLWDKLRAAELLGRHAGFLKEPEQKVIVDVADRLLQARQRVMRALPSAGAEGGEAASGEE